MQRPTKQQLKHRWHGCSGAYQLRWIMFSQLSNQQLASKILETKGTLITEYSANSPISKANFIERNRIVSGLCDVLLLITEAAVNSGSLHTARFALEQGKTVMAVPGNINSPTSEGCNNLIKSGAVPVTNGGRCIFCTKNKAGKTKRGQGI
jgi:predicted Rossmann fold nucleotide-binding protein DprA/Smf involved in DNA uptake